MELVRPSELESINESNPVEAVLLLKQYLAVLSSEQDKVKNEIQAICSQAYSSGCTGNDDYWIQVWYKEGYKVVPDINLLQSRHPTLYGRLYQKQLESYVPRLTKKDYNWLVHNQERREEILKETSQMVPTAPYYYLRRKVRWTSSS